VATQGSKYKANVTAIKEGAHLLAGHPLTRRFERLNLDFDTPLAFAQHPESWIFVRSTAATWGPSRRPNVTVIPNVRRRAPAAHWAYVLGRIGLHEVMNHLDPDRNEPAWHAACWLIAESIMSNAGFAQRPAEMVGIPGGYSLRDEAALAQRLQDEGIPETVRGLSLGVPGRPFWEFGERCVLTEQVRRENRASLANGLRDAASAAIEVAGGVRSSIRARQEPTTNVKRAMSWVVSEYPMLAALGSSFSIIEDADICERMDISVAAVWTELREIYINPRVGLAEMELRFVIAHELLHVGLRHDIRQQGRNGELWNVACDYTINAWLIEMRVGEAPDRIGYLYDPELAKCSSEEIYDRITGDLRWMRKLEKHRGWAGKTGDIRTEKPPVWWTSGGMDLDAFYRRALAEGLKLHQQQGRGTIPAGLIEEVRALQQPPIPWDVRLAQWLDVFFPPLEHLRSYGRANRRQGSTPDIPRPGWITPEDRKASRTFGVLLDTSGSVSRRELGKALGAIASYALSRDVSAVRLIECDAHPHDAGYVEPDELLETVKLHGRGGTVLMPGIRLLERADDFPTDAPILVITDGDCDVVTTPREHAFLIPERGKLAFRTERPVFRFSDD